MLAVLTQNGVDGVEVEGSECWARPSLSPSSFLVVAGDTLKVLRAGADPRPIVRYGGIANIDQRGLPRTKRIHK